MHQALQLVVAPEPLVLRGRRHIGEHLGTNAEPAQHRLVRGDIGRHVAGVGFRELLPEDGARIPRPIRPSRHGSFSARAQRRPFIRIRLPGDRERIAAQTVRYLEEIGPDAARLERLFAGHGSRAALGGSRKSFAEGACGGARKLERVELTAQRLEPARGLEKRRTGERGDSFRRLAQGDPASPVGFKTL